MTDVLRAAPRVRMAHLPTPIEKMGNLSRNLGACTIWVKRDDCTGLAAGGSKARKLDFLIGDALNQGAEVIVTHGAVQSNHLRQTAAACARHGLHFEALLEERVRNASNDYYKSGNRFLTQMIGGKLHYCPAGADMSAALEECKEELLRAGRRPYVVPGGGSSRIGSLGYVECAYEILAQSEAMGVKFDLVVHATGSGGTQAGLVAGMASRKNGIPILGFGVDRPQSVQHAHVFEHALETLRMIDPSACIGNGNIHVDCGYIGGGYGVPTDGMVEAVMLGARLEGLLFDPVYTGKALAGMIGNLRAGNFAGMKDILFIHTGGAASLFAYPELLRKFESRNGVATA
ncbi:MAG: D-cysteine desulfhydrase [Pseudomonadota bacterium]